MCACSAVWQNSLSANWSTTSFRLSWLKTAADISTDNVYFSAIFTYFMMILFSNVYVIPMLRRITNSMAAPWGTGWRNLHTSYRYVVCRRQIEVQRFFQDNHADLCSNISCSQSVLFLNMAYICMAHHYTVSLYWQVQYNLNLSSWPQGFRRRPLYLVI